MPYYVRQRDIVQKREGDSQSAVFEGSETDGAGFPVTLFENITSRNNLHQTFQDRGSGQSFRTGVQDRVSGQG